MNEIQFASRGHKRAARKRTAVLALEGATPSDLRRCLALAASYDPHAILIAVDGGLATCRALRRRPNLFVGDVDSARKAPRGVEACIYPVVKDFSDCSGALGEARERGAEVVVIAGLLGGRLDHEWANLFEIAAQARGFLGLLAPSSRGLIVVTATRVRARTTPRRPLSVFALGGGALVSLRGASFKLDRQRVTPGSLGLSNVTGETLALDVHRGVVALVFPAGGSA